MPAACRVRRGCWGALAAAVVALPAAAQTSRTFEFTLPESAPQCAPQPGGAMTAAAFPDLAREVPGATKGVPLVFANGLTLLLGEDGKLLDPAVDHLGDAVGSLTVDPATGAAVLTLRAPTLACPALRATGTSREVAATDRSRRIAVAWQSLLISGSEGGRAAFDAALARVEEVQRERTGLQVDDALIATVLIRRSWLLVSAGRPREAISVLEAVPPSLLNPVSRRAAIGLEQAKTTALKGAGRSGVALPLAQQVAVRAAELLGDDDAYTIQARRELGEIYREVRRFDDAITLFEQVRPALVARYGEENRRVFDNELAIAGSLNEAGRPDEALSKVEPLIATLRRLYGDDDPVTQLALSHRFSCLNKMRRHDEALVAVEELLVIRRRVYGPHHPRTLFALRGLAVTQWARGEREAAIELDRQVIDGYEAAFGPDHPETLHAMHNTAVALQDAGRIAEALQVAGRVVDSVERQQEWASLAPETRQSYFSRWANTYKMQARLHSKLGDAEAAFRMIELTKTRTLLDATTTRIARNAAIDDPDERAAVVRLEQRQETLNAEHARAVGNPELRTRIDLDRNRVAAELRALNDSLAARYPRFARLRDLRAITSAQLQEALPPRTLFLNYSLDGVHVAVAAVSREHGLSTHVLGRVPRLLVNLEALATVMAAPDADTRILWRDEAGWFRLQREESDDPVRPARAAELAEHLANALLEPFAELIASHERVIVSPDTSLALVPLEALPFRGAPLVRQVEVGYAPSAAVFWLSQGLAREHDRRSGRVGLLALGGIDYAASGTAEGDASGPLDPTTPTRRAGTAQRLLGPLPASRREVERAAQHLRAAGVRTLLGKDANKSALLEMSRSGELQKYRTVLVSAHGVLDAERPALSAIVLAPNEAGDRFVTAADWMTMRLASDLIVASACETALGGRVNGEGVTGLPFAFHVAGSARSLLTLWKVDDAASARFVDAYFARLSEGDTPSRALRAVKLQFLGDPRVAKPFFWAPFVLFGAADSQR